MLPIADAGETPARSGKVGLAEQTGPIFPRAGESARDSADQDDA